ncbi:MAG TPA: hypothetical protein DEH27_00215 [Deltaproteobacteria bacterium]|nr:hypothetical protein [Deltaproteobacteria bacterium]
MSQGAGPITKKAPGDRPISFEEVGRFASLIMERASEGKVTDLPPSAMKQIVSILRKRQPPEFLTSIDPSSVPERTLTFLRKLPPARGRASFTRSSTSMPVRRHRKSIRSPSGAPALEEGIPS